MRFRDKLLATLRAIQPVLEQPGVLVVGSEIPNLLEHGAASTLVVSQDVDVGVPVSSHPAVKRLLSRRSIPVALGQEMLSAPHIALVRFGDVSVLPSGSAD